MHWQAWRGADWCWLLTVFELWWTGLSYVCLGGMSIVALPSMLLCFCMEPTPMQSVVGDY
jgi:hypothetical protein